MTSALRTRLCDLLDIRYPIIQAGMGTFSDPPLAAAVSNAGGLGVLGGAGYEPDALRAAVREIRQRTGKPFGVDLLLPASKAQVKGSTHKEMKSLLPREQVEFVENLRRQSGLPDVKAVRSEKWYSDSRYTDQINVVLEERVPVIAIGLGRADEVTPRAHALGLKVIAMASHVRMARAHAADGVDIIVAEGYDAGGHTGKIGTLALIPQVVDAVRPIPVVAAGGIADGRGLVAALALGAVGVWCGTAFLLTPEATITEYQRDKIIKATEEDAIISKVYTGKTMRQIKNKFTNAWEKSGVSPLAFPLQGMLVEDFHTATLAAAAKDPEMAEYLRTPAGQISGMLTKRKTAKQVIDDMVSGAEQVLAGLAPG